MAEGSVNMVLLVVLLGAVAFVLCELGLLVLMYFAAQAEASQHDYGIARLLGESCYDNVTRPDPASPDRKASWPMKQHRPERVGPERVGPEPVSHVRCHRLWSGIWAAVLWLAQAEPPGFVISVFVEASPGPVLPLIMGISA